MDGNLIFSQESYVPRSAMVNLTVSLFGESLNLFEIGSRAEGFESMIEDFFGPEGYFRLVIYLNAVEVFYHTLIFILQKLRTDHFVH